MSDTIGNQVKNTLMSPFSWMFKYGPILWFVIVPGIIFLCVYLYQKHKNKKKEQALLESRVQGLE